MCLLFSFVPASVTLYGYKESTESRIQISQVVDNSPMSGNVVPLSTEESVDFIQFTSSHTGWLGSHSSELYRTTDAGNTWESVDLGVTGFLAQMRFVSDRVGWVIVDQYIKDADKPNGTYSKLLHTEDAGKTWTTELDLKGAELLDLVVENGKEVWLVGNKFSKRFRYTVSEVLLLQSENAGAEWIDRSDQLNRMLMSIDGRVYDSPAALFALAPKTLILLTEFAVILRSSDDGANWSRTASLNTEGLPANKLVAHTGFPLVLAGMGGGHGSASMLMTSADDGSFITSQIGATYLKDMLFIPGKGIIACGSMQVQRKEPPRFRNEGLILFSADLGRNWITIHRTTEVRSINSLELNGQTIWAGGAKGYLVKLTTDLLLPVG